MEDKLQIARQEINEIDTEMAKLFVRRMKAVTAVAEYKKERGLPIFDSTREQEVIEKNVGRVEEIEFQPYYKKFIQDTMDVSKQYQRKFVNGTNVAYCGVEGAFAYIASKKLFPDAKLIAYKDFQSTYKAVENGECDCAVLPIENSYAGEVGTVLDIMFGGSLYINRTYALKVSQCLLGTPNSDISKIKTVISHPQALEQCSGFIQKHGFQVIQGSNTALAAKEVSEKNDPTVAAIASVEAAELYGLKVLDHDINEIDNNCTRFAVVSRTSASKAASSKNNHIMLMFTVKNEAGALSKAINVIGSYGYSMSMVRSRPMKSLAWEYYFYIEAVGDGTNDNEKKMLEALKTTCDKLKVLGSMEWNNN